MAFDDDEPMMKVRVEKITGQTAKGLWVRFTDRDGDEQEVCLGKSRIDYDGDVGDEDVLIELPEWMAEANGMDHLPE